MKKATLFSTLILVSVIGFTQSIEPNQTQVRVSIEDRDSTILINVIDLIGEWKNVSSTLPIVGSNVPKAVIEIRNGNQVIINDAWREDYPNKLKNTTWIIVDDNLQFNSPELGKIEVDISKLKKSNTFEMIINTFTYRRLINLSSN